VAGAPRRRRPADRDPRGHLEDIAGRFEETPYLGVGYVLLIAGCAVAAKLLVRPVRSDHGLGWTLASGLAALSLLGFVLTRTVGRPRATDDKVNWHETLGVWSMSTEGALVVLVAGCLAVAPRPDPAIP
jgi:hypothetical protein